MTSPPAPGQHNHAAETDEDEIRATLRANGVNRYGRFERENTYGALEALDRLSAALAAAEASAARAEEALRDLREKAAAFERIPDKWSNGDERDALRAALSGGAEGTAE